MALIDSKQLVMYRDKRYPDLYKIMRVCINFYLFSFFIFIFVFIFIFLFIFIFIFIFILFIFTLYIYLSHVAPVLINIIYYFFFRVAGVKWKKHVPHS